VLEPQYLSWEQIREPSKVFLQVFAVDTNWGVIFSSVQGTQARELRGVFGWSQRECPGTGSDSGQRPALLSVEMTNQAVERRE